MSNDEFELYRLWLSGILEQESSQDKVFAQTSFSETVKCSPAYQGNAIINGVLQPIVATRKDTNKCSIAVIPGSRVYIGDLVEVFDEHWICVEMYKDEFGMCYGELWMCNHIFLYQDFDLKIIRKYAIIDDGSYSNNNDKSIKVTDNKFNCYISLDEESRALHIDKRLGISVIYDKNGNEILEVGKIVWIDVKSHNFGDGSHLMVFGINDDPYNPDTDNIDEMICDYKSSETLITNAQNENQSDNVIDIRSLSIVGNKTIKAGSSRTYNVISASDSNLDLSGIVEWRLENSVNGISIIPNGASCKVCVKEDDDLVGVIFEIRCSCLSGQFKETNFTVEVT